MKKKIRLFLVLVLLISIATMLFLNEFTVNGRDNKTLVTDITSRNRSADDSTWPVISEGVITLENSNVKFEMDAKTTHFSVIDKKGSQKYSSVPDFAVTTTSNEDENRIKSDLSIEYYDNQSMRYYLSSSTNSVDYGAFSVKKEGGAVRVYYNLRNSKTVIFAPVAFSQQDFEEKILTKLSSAEKRRIKFFYTLYDRANKNADYLKMRENYQYLDQENMYIQNAGIEQQDYEEITGYMQKAGFTQDDYDKSIAKMNLSEDLQNKPASFEIAVEYTLEEDGFNAKILSDKIKTAGSNYTIQNVTLLEYFGSAGSDASGYFLVPDGCGAILPVNDKKGQKYEKQLYGNDPSISTSSNAQSVQRSTLPVFGFNRTSGGFFAIIEGAAEAGSIHAKTMGNENPANNIFTSFDLRGMDSTDIGKSRNIPKINLYAKHILYENPSIRYSLLGREKSDYSSMANYYQKYLIEKGVLKNRLTLTENIPLYMDFAGLVTKNTSILGVPYQKKIILSTVSDIHGIVTSLKEEGITECNVRIQGYGSGGLSNYANDRFDFDSQVGSIGDLKNLSASLEENGGALYIESDFSVVYQKSIFHPFSLKLDSARKLDKSFTRFGDYDLVTLDFSNPGNARYLVTPSAYTAYAQNFIRDMDKTLDADNKIQYSWSSSGYLIGSDFNYKSEFDRVMTKEAIQKTLGLMGQHGKKVMTDGGNAYVLGFSDSIMNLPLTSSLFAAQERSVPFYPMVVHGFVDYAGAPVNISLDPERSLLNSIESGANLYYSYITKQDDLIKETDYDQGMFPANYQNNRQSMLDQYEQWNTIFKNLRQQTIKSHKQLGKGVFATVYEEGSCIYVNYNDVDVTVEGVSIKAGGYLLKEKEGAYGGK